MRSVVEFMEKSEVGREYLLLALLKTEDIFEKFKMYREAIKVGKESVVLLKRYIS